MSATDELRRLLDERGVEWVAIGTDTCWTGADGYPMGALETANGTHMRVADLTPEQAVEATLGSDLKAENNKLRELVQDMYACIEALCSMVENSPSCSMCPTNQDEEKPCAAADVYCRMRELGVEV